MTISAKIICDSVSPDGIRLTTLQLRYPRFIHSEFMTHRVFSRNASSSRAVPVEKLIEDIKRDTAMPIYWGKNQKGMQAEEECNEKVIIDSGTNNAQDFYLNAEREYAWGVARNRAIEMALAFQKAGYHKQIVNRLIEPFSHINVVVTATDWDNFFKLRDHKDAQPEIRELAIQMKKVMNESFPAYLGYGDWHLPYIKEEDFEQVNVAVGGGYKYPWYNTEVMDYIIKCSAARCARVSYLTHDFKEPKLEDDLKRYELLAGSDPKHMSPLEHQATPDKKITFGAMTKWQREKEHGNFRGWVQYRKTVEDVSPDCLKEGYVW